MTELRISMAGSGAVLLDGAGPRFEEGVQHRVWAVAEALRDLPWVRETVPGMNNLLVSFDPLGPTLDTVTAACRDLWASTAAKDIAGRSFNVLVQYGGARGEDLPGLAARTGLSIDEVVRRHAAPTYRVAAIGAMPGNPYLFGLDPSLAWPRRSSPRLSVSVGSVIIGGAQAGVIPCTVPSGWHILGHTEMKLFDPYSDPPCLLRPGDRLRFTVAGITA